MANCEPGVKHHCTLGLMYEDEVERVRAAKRYAIANTPLASVPLKSGPKKARRPGTIRPGKQVMGYAKHRSGY